MKTEALTLRTAGYTHAYISDKTGISISSLKRLFKDHKVKKGELKKELIEKATQDLINDSSSVESIKREVAALIMDDVALVKRLRQAMGEAAEMLTATDTAEALQVMRAVSSGAVALKSTSETLRKSLGIDKEKEISDDLPELTITIMTDEEVEAVKEKARQRNLGVGDGLGGVLSEEEIVSYSDEGSDNVVA
jgi:nucleoside diphosphate kinase